MLKRNRCIALSGRDRLGEGEAADRFRNPAYGARRRY